MLPQHTVFAVDRDEVLRLHQRVHEFEFFLTGVAGDVHLRQRLIDDVRAAAVQLVDNAADALLVAGNGRGGDNHRIALPDLQLAVFAVRHARQACHRLALTARRHHQNLVVRVLVERVRLNNGFRRNPQFANLHRYAADVDHAAPDEADAAAVAQGVVNDHLHTVDVRREHGDNHTPLRVAEHVLERHANLLFGDGVTGALDVGGFAQHRQHAALAQLSEGRKVGDMPIDGRVVNFEVASDDDRTRRAGERNGARPRDGVADVDELRREVLAQPHLVARLHHLHRDALNAVLLQLQVHQRQRQFRSVERRGHLAQDVRRRADVVLVSVGKEVSAHVALLLHQIGHIRNDQIDAQHILFGENAAAVNHHNVILIFKNCHVLADFIHTAKADNPQAACRLRCFRSRGHTITLFQTFSFLLFHILPSRK